MLPASATISTHGNSASSRRSSRRARGSSSTIIAFIRTFSFAWGIRMRASAKSGTRKIEVERGSACRTTSATARLHCAGRRRAKAIGWARRDAGSRLRSTSACSRISALIRNTPPCGSSAIPCLIAFSTTVCSSITGMCATRASTRNRALDAQTLAEPQRFELQIVGDDLQLALQRDDFFLARGQRVAQRPRQLRHGLLRAGRIVRDQCTHAVQRIEQEVRIELRLEQPQLRDLQRARQLRLAQLAPAAGRAAK